MSQTLRIRACLPTLVRRVSLKTQPLLGARPPSSSRWPTALSSPATSSHAARPLLGAHAPALALARPHRAHSCLPTLVRPRTSVLACLLRPGRRMSSHPHGSLAASFALDLGPPRLVRTRTIRYPPPPTLASMYHACSRPAGLWGSPATILLNSAPGPDIHIASTSANGNASATLTTSTSPLTASRYTAVPCSRIPMLDTGVESRSRSHPRHNRTSRQSSYHCLPASRSRSPPFPLAPAHPNSSAGASRSSADPLVHRNVAAVPPARLTRCLVCSRSRPATSRACSHRYTPRPCGPPSSPVFELACLLHAYTTGRGSLATN
ncbi:hypothetical protein FRC08_015874 [Ceratobasidium sp. 394]|nr:hypothetical protein FRC08_015874 [Ceratobasidium sp. 394]